MVTILCFTIAVFVVLGGVGLVPRIFSEVFRRTFKFGRVTNNKFNTILVGKIGENLFSGRTNSKSTPYTTTTTRNGEPRAIKVIRSLKILVSAVIVYAYATVVVLLTPHRVASNLRNVSLLRTTVGCRLNDNNAVFITVILFLFDFSAFVKVLFCTHSGITCLYNGG